VHQLKITLRYTRPPIWRRLLVPSEILLSDLHDVIQIAMGWTGGHLHQFEVAGVYYTDFDEDDLLDARSEGETKTRLNAIAPREGGKLRYDYDFGDGWDHSIIVEKVLPRERGRKYPVCLAGRRACPPEDCGGPHGYSNLLEALQDPKHPDHKDLAEWIGGEFDPEAFDLEAVNKLLRDPKVLAGRRAWRELLL
jgi:hypothetical protein